MCHGPVSVCISVCLCPSVTWSVETAERIELGFGVGASLDLSYTVLKGNLLPSKIKELSFGTLSQTQDLENFVMIVSKVRRRSSLWITPMTVDASLLGALCLILVGRP